MKYLSLIACLIILGCGREADRIKAPTSFVERSQTDKLEPNEVRANSKMRAMTLLSYPLQSDVTDWSFNYGEETKNSWNTFLESLTFRDRLITSFPLEMDAVAKVREAVVLVQSAGESRDQAYKKLVPLLKQMAKIDQQKENLKLEKTPTDLDTINCYYAKRAAPNKSTECKSKAEGEYTKVLKTSKCSDFVKYKFIDIEANVQIQQRMGQCLELQAELDQLTAENKKLDSQKGDLELVRSAGESIVLDLLQSIEKVNPGLVLVATGATIEKNKTDTSSPVSKITISENQITELSLRIDFGTNLSTGSGKVEYSLENGKIANMTFQKESDGVWTLRFDIMTSDFVVRTNLSYSVHPTLGMRFVGEANYIYSNGVTRKGVMKLEFDLE